MCTGKMTDRASSLGKNALDFCPWNHAAFGRSGCAIAEFPQKASVITRAKLLTTFYRGIQRGALLQSSPLNRTLVNDRTTHASPRVHELYARACVIVLTTTPDRDR
jgi:hypothetical protein